MAMTRRAGVRVASRVRSGLSAPRAVTASARRGPVRWPRLQAAPAGEAARAARRGRQTFRPRAERPACGASQTAARIAADRGADPGSWSC